MFWGCVLKEGQPYKVQHVLEDGEYPVLHLSNVSLSKDAKKDAGKSYLSLSIKSEGGDKQDPKNAHKNLQNLTLATLSPERHENQRLDLYLNLSQNITLKCHGKNDIHLSGFFESQQQQGIEDFPYDAEDDEEEGEDELNAAAVSTEELKNLLNGASKKTSPKADKKPADVEGFKKGGDLDKSLKAAKKNAEKNVVQVAGDSSDDEQLGDDEEESEGDYLGEEDDESGEDFGQLDLEAEEGEDEELDSDLEQDSDEDMKKVDAIKKKHANKSEQKTAGKPATPTIPELSDPEDDDESSDEEEMNLQTMLKKQHKKPNMKQPSPGKVQKTEQGQSVKQSTPEKAKNQQPNDKAKGQFNQSSAAPQNSEQQNDKKRNKKKKKNKKK